MNKDDVTAIRDTIIEAALPHIPFDGWGWESITSAAQEAGYESDIPRAVFQDGMIDVLDAFADWADRQMLAALKDQNPDGFRIRDRIRTALVARLTILAPHKDAVKQSAAFWVVPTRKPRALKITWRTADRIWDWAGDTSDDYNRYTKRGLLVAVIVPTMFAWFEDDNEAMDSTKAFIDRRIGNVMQLGRFTAHFKSKFSHKQRAKT